MENENVSRGRFAFLYVMAWLPLGVLYALILGMQSNVSAIDAILGTVFTIGLAALLGVGVWWLSHRIRYQRSHRVRFVLVHVLFSLLYAGLLTGEVTASIYFRAPAAAFQRYVTDALGWQLLFGMSIYGLLVGISYALQASRRLRDEELRGAHLESLRIDAELRALRTQLNPHFLFNTLHSITALVRMEPARGEQSLEQFASLLRYVLDVNREPSEEVPLEEELQFVRTYLALEQLRLGERLVVNEDVESDALECLVLAFSLQPLVENAIRHGIAPRAGAGELRIGAHLSGEQLVLEVSDDGVGAEPAQFQRADGLGMSAVRQRLQTRWGTQAHMEVETALQRGFRVRITMPAVTTPVLRSSGPRAPEQLLSDGHVAEQAAGV